MWQSRDARYLTFSQTRVRTLILPVNGSDEGAKLPSAEKSFLLVSERRTGTSSQSEQCQDGGCERHTSIHDLSLSVSRDNLDENGGGAQNVKRRPVAGL